MLRGNTKSNVLEPRTPMEKLAKRERPPIRRHLKQETPASYLIRLLVGVPFLFGLYGGQLLTARQMPPTGGKADDVPGIGSSAVLTGFESGEV